jgi:hypothetical protein
MAVSGGGFRRGLRWAFRTGASRATARTDASSTRSAGRTGGVDLRAAWPAPRWWCSATYCFSSSSAWPTIARFRRPTVVGPLQEALMPERTPAGLFEGTLLRQGDPGYDGARADAVWNGLTPERFPEAILQAATERDIPLALAWARAQGLHVSTRSGGHNWSGSQLRDGGLLIDLSRLRHCSVDPVSATAEVGPAVTGTDLVEALAPHDLAFPVGHRPTSPVTRSGTIRPRTKRTPGGCGRRWPRRTLRVAVVTTSPKRIWKPMPTGHGARTSPPTGSACRNSSSSGNRTTSSTPTSRPRHGAPGPSVLDTHPAPITGTVTTSPGPHVRRWVATESRPGALGVRSDDVALRLELDRFPFAMVATAEDSLMALRPRVVPSPPDETSA